MLGIKKKVAPVLKNGAETFQKAIDPLRNLGECLWVWSRSGPVISPAPSSSSACVEKPLIDTHVNVPLHKPRYSRAVYEWEYALCSVCFVCVFLSETAVNNLENCTVRFADCVLNTKKGNK